MDVCTSTTNNNTNTGGGNGNGPGNTGGNTSGPNPQPVSAEERVAQFEKKMISAGVNNDKTHSKSQVSVANHHDGAPKVVSHSKHGEGSLSAGNSEGKDASQTNSKYRLMFR